MLNIKCNIIAYLLYKMTNDYIRSSFFISKEIALFLEQEAKKQKKNKGQRTKALQLLKKEKLKLEIEKYYSDPKNYEIEKKMPEESFL